MARDPQLARELPQGLLERAADGREPLLMHSGARPACVRGLLLGSVLPGSAEEAHGVGSKSAEGLHRERLNGLKACGRDGWVARALTGLGKTKRGPVPNSCPANVLVGAGVPNGDVRIAFAAGPSERDVERPRAVSAAPARHLDLTGRHTGPRFAEQCLQFVDNTGAAVRFKTPVLAHDCVVPQRVQGLRAAPACGLALDVACLAWRGIVATPRRQREAWQKAPPKSSVRQPSRALQTRNCPAPSPPQERTRAASLGSSSASRRSRAATATAAEIVRWQPRRGATAQAPQSGSLLSGTPQARRTSWACKSAAAPGCDLSPACNAFVTLQASASGSRARTGAMHSAQLEAKAPPCLSDSPPTPHPPCRTGSDSCSSWMGLGGPSSVRLENGACKVASISAGPCPSCPGGLARRRWRSLGSMHKRNMSWHSCAALRIASPCGLSSLCTSRVGVLDLGKQRAAGICSCLPVLLRGMAGAKGGAGVEKVLRGVAPSFYRAAKEDKAYLRRYTADWFSKLVLLIARPPCFRLIGIALDVCRCALHLRNVVTCCRFTPAFFLRLNPVAATLKPRPGPQWDPDPCR